jgi:hypothetical protein
MSFQSLLFDYIALQAVDISWDGYITQEDLPTLETFHEACRRFLRDSQNLREIQLGWVEVDWTSKFHHLVVLRLHKMSLPSSARFDALLRSSLALQELDLTQCEGEINDNQNPFDFSAVDAIPLPGLTLLRLRDIGLNTVMQIFTTVQANALDELFIDADLVDIINCLTVFLSRRAPNLAELTINDVNALRMEEPTFSSFTEEKISILGALPHLRKLQFVGGITSVEPLQAMTPSLLDGEPEPRCLCPNLQELHLDSNRLSPTRLAEMVVARAEFNSDKVKTLQKVSVEDCRPPLSTERPQTAIRDSIITILESESVMCQKWEWSVEEF